MSPCDTERICRTLASLGVLWLVLACDAQASTDKLSPHPSTLGPGTPARSGETSLLSPEAVRAAKGAIDDKLGPATKALELRAYPDRWVLQAEDPDRPGRLFQLKYEHDRLGAPLEMTLRGSGDLEQNLFSLQNVAFDAIPKLVHEAELAVDPEDGVVEYVLLRRALPFKREVEFRVFVKSPRRDGHLDADHLGRPIE